MELSLNKEDVKDSDSVISAYISKIYTLKSNMDESGILVYRGEARDFKESSCQPNIFRKFNLDVDRNVEINILNTMLSKKYAIHTSYFETAVEAQHGGFPSRLLDVTYNALIALFFSVTPHYTEKEDIYDEEPSVVYLFNIPKMYSPASSDVRELYKNLLQDDSPLRTENLFSNTYKLLDHSSQNDRIIAQQGAFILFYGNKSFSLPKRIQSKLLICPSLKEKIRKELSSMFNINMGTMYPEMTNNVENILSKINNINAMPFSYANEIKLLISELEIECKHRLDRFKTNKTSNGIEKVKSFDAIFDPMNIFKNSLLLARDNPKVKVEDAELDLLVKEYNQYVSNLHSYLDNRFSIQAPPIEHFLIDLEKNTEVITQ
ncbi:FRG domain-containing protein [Priestia filamentosa]|uniref:FRG domain-containing protein n=1 Tax=Priestia filamentosa TaxID=1402861 RepID=UPI0039823762